MKLFTQSQYQCLVMNYERQDPVRGTPHEIDFEPVVKLFNPVGAGTWLLTELEPNEQIAFGLCDLGMQCPELGSVSIIELESVRLPMGLGIERDRYWVPKKTILAYAREAWAAGRIVA